MEDTADKSEPASYRIAKVFESKSDAEAYAATDISRYVEEQEVIPHTATASE